MREKRKLYQVELTNKNNSFLFMSWDNAVQKLIANAPYSDKAITVIRRTYLDGDEKEVVVWEVPDSGLITEVECED